MKTTTFYTLATLGVALFASQVQAQLQQPTPATRVAMNYTYYTQDPDPTQAEPSPSDVPPPPGVDIEEGVADDAAEAVAEECEGDEGPCRLFNLCGVDVYGHVSGGRYYNGDGNSRGFGNQPLGFRNVSDGFTMDQFWLTAEKSLDDCCPSWGFRVDYVFGADGPDTNAFGSQPKFDFRWQSSRDYASALPQLYAQYGTSDFNVKIGHFYTIIGYEVVSAPDNFFYSHAYTMYYGEPFTHTGFLAEKTMCCDQITVWAGWTNGWDAYFDNYLDASTFLGGVSYAVNDNLTAIYTVNVGDFGDGTARKGVPSNQGDIYMQSVVIDYQINECVEYVFQTDYANNNINGTHDEWYGVNQYLFYTLNSCYKLGMRFEWFNDADGVRIVNSDAAGTAIGNDVNYYSITTGVNYTPNSNVIIRPEVRYDWAHGGRPFNPNGAGIGQSRDQFYYGMDFIVLF